MCIQLNYNEDWTLQLKPIWEGKQCCNIVHIAKAIQISGGPLSFMLMTCDNRKYVQQHRMDVRAKKKDHQKEIHRPTHMFRWLFLDLFIIRWMTEHQVTKMQSSTPKKKYDQFMNYHIRNLFSNINCFILSNSVMDEIEYLHHSRLRNHNDQIHRRLWRSIVTCMLNVWWFCIIFTARGAQHVLVILLSLSLYRQAMMTSRRHQKYG